MKHKPNLSIVIPVFNEKANLKILHISTEESLKVLNRKYEIIYIDDGSTDNGISILKDIAARGKNVKILQLFRNFGQTAALAAGFDYACGEIIISLDGDIQNDPRDIERLVDKMEEGNYDIVSGWRKNRKDLFFSRRFPSMIANKIIS